MRSRRMGKREQFAYMKQLAHSKELTTRLIRMQTNDRHRNRKRATKPTVGGSGAAIP